MSPVAALEYVRSRRPRVHLAPSQWKAVQEYKQQRMASRLMCTSGDAVLITKADLEGYHSPCNDCSVFAIFLMRGISHATLGNTFCSRSTSIPTRMVFSDQKNMVFRSSLTDSSRSSTPTFFPIDSSPRDYCGADLQHYTAGREVFSYGWST
ncbi:hypothetical protein RD792_014621 [Penstemon davidsonii]|uniref:Uncharacterized protein n=1 Tax=Penstemon davidsonii TaxID=160366 RepID=A0ABR0CQV0_9LAMI|nr:hypothetical protein RD792_014621 [Penstemon davidsonii]